MSVSLKEKLELVRLYREGLIDPGAIRQDVLHKKSQELALEIITIRKVFESRLQSVKGLFQERLDEARALHPMEAVEEQKTHLQQTVNSLSIIIEEITQDLAKAKERVPLERGRVQELKAVLQGYEKALHIPESHGIETGSYEIGKKVATYNQRLKPDNDGWFA